MNAAERLARRLLGAAAVAAAIVVALAVARLGAEDQDPRQVSPEARQHVEAGMEALTAMLTGGEPKEDFAAEVKSLVQEAGIELFVRLGPRALKRLGELQRDCGLVSEEAESKRIAREIVEKNLSELQDPEWRSSYRLLYQGIL